jgi:hypothetical protein
MPPEISTGISWIDAQIEAVSQDSTRKDRIGNACFYSFILATAVGIFWSCWNERVVQHPPGVLVEEEPLQEDVEAKTWTYGKYTLKALARYHIKARVLSKAHYHLGAFAELAPYDLALGWREMSDSAVLDQLNFYQARRKFYLSFRHRPPAHFVELVATFSNNHIILADDMVLTAIRFAHVGDIICILPFRVADVQ